MVEFVIWPSFTVVAARCSQPLLISAAGRDKTPVMGPTGVCQGTAIGGQQLQLGELRTPCERP